MNAKCSTWCSVKQAAASFRRRVTAGTDDGRSRSQVVEAVTAGAPSRPVAQPVDPGDDCAHRRGGIAARARGRRVSLPDAHSSSSSVTTIPSAFIGIALIV
jgi:hypothetical protein